MTPIPIRKGATRRALPAGNRKAATTSHLERLGGRQGCIGLPGNFPEKSLGHGSPRTDSVLQVQPRR